MDIYSEFLSSKSLDKICGHFWFSLWMGSKMGFREKENSWESNEWFYETIEYMFITVFMKCEGIVNVRFTHLQCTA